MKNSVKTVLTVGLLSAIATGGVALAASAQRQMSAATALPVTRVAQMVNREANAGSEHEDGVDKAQEARERAHYQSLAKITPQQGSTSSGSGSGRSS